jgi:hypothetical protein
LVTGILAALASQGAISASPLLDRTLIVVSPTTDRVEKRLGLSARPRSLNTNR